MKRHSRSKTREMDRIRSLDRGRDADYRSRSRSRGRSKHFTHDLVIVSLCDDGNKCFIVQQLFWYCIKKWETNVHQIALIAFWFNLFFKLNAIKQVKCASYQRNKWIVVSLFAKMKKQCGADNVVISQEICTPSSLLRHSVLCEYLICFTSGKV